MEWQPIETAPKDGTEVLCFSDDLGIFVAYIDDHNHNQKPKWSTGFGEKSEIDPTHWMPLPAPPKAPE